jgi:hypothetical protein
MISFGMGKMAEEILSDCRDNTKVLTGAQTKMETLLQDGACW